VLVDSALLTAVDNFIRANIAEISTSKYLETNPKIQIEILQNSNEERDATNQRHLVDMLLEWLRGYKIDINVLTAKVFMLYLNTTDKKLHDCNDIEIDDSNYSDVVGDYKSLSRKTHFPRKVSDERKKEENTNLAPSQTPSKPSKFLFTRSDSESSLSSIADDDDNDWKVLATHCLSKHSVIGLVMIAGKLCLLSVKLRLNHPKHPETVNKKESVDNSDIYSPIPPMSSARCSAGAACLNQKLVVCGKCLNSVQLIGMFGHFY